jgi:hypothetical protein
VQITLKESLSNPLAKHNQAINNKLVANLHASTVCLGLRLCELAAAQV